MARPYLHSMLVRAAMGAALLFAPSARAQDGARLTDARIRELVREASRMIGGGSAPGRAIAVPIAGGTAAPASPPVVALTIDDAIRLALDRNLEIAVQRLNPEIQDLTMAGLQAAYRPSLTSSVSQGGLVQAPVSQLQLSSSNGAIEQTTTTYNVGLAQNVARGGGSLLIALNNSRLASTSNSAFYNPQFQSNWSAVYTQPLLRNLRIDATRQELLVTKINRDMSDIQLRALVANTVSNVRNAYWDLVWAAQSVDVAHQSLELATRLVGDNRSRMEVGTMSAIDIVQAQAEEAVRRQALVAAESARRTAELAFKRLLVAGTDDPNWTATIDPVDRPAFQPEPVDIEAAVRRALDARTDIGIAKKALQSNDVTVRYLVDQTRPQVDLVGTYGAQGLGGPYLDRTNAGVLGSSIARIVPGGITDSFDTLFRDRYPRWSVQTNLSYPIGLTAQRAAVARARVQFTQTQTQLKLLEVQIATEVTSAAIQVRNSAEAVQAAQAARELAATKLDAESQRLGVGMSTNYFVVQAQRDLADAANSELRAILTYRKALVELERAQQTTLQGANITIIHP
jgi:outer membrane protein